MSIWKTSQDEPAGVLPSNIITKIGVVVIAVLLGAMILTLSFSGGGGDSQAVLEAPEAADQALQDRAQAAIAAEARRQAQDAETRLRLAQQQLAAQEAEATLPDGTVFTIPGGLAELDNAVTGPLTEAEAILLETLRLEDIERRRRSLRAASVVLSYRDIETRPDTGPLSSLLGPQVAALPFGTPAISQAVPPITPNALEGTIASAADFIALAEELNAQEAARNSAAAMPATETASPMAAGQVAGLGSPGLVGLDGLPSPIGSLNGLLPGQLLTDPIVPDPAEPEIVSTPNDPAGWDRIYEGSFLEAVLVTQLNGDFPGPVLAMASVPFYSADRQRVLIPRGTRILGSARAVGGLDQERLAVAFHRLVWPDGRSVSLRFNGLNQMGEGALKDQVNRHYFSMFAAAGAVGILSGLTARGSDPYSGGRAGFQAGASQGLGQASVQIVSRFLNRLPTITIRAGHRLRIWFTGDVLMPPLQEASNQ